MGRIIVWIVGLALLSIVYAAAIHFQVDKIETDLKDRSSLALQNFPWAEVVVDGRDVLIEGLPPSNEAIEDAKKTVRSVWGVRKVDCQCPVTAKSIDQSERASIETTAPSVSSSNSKIIPNKPPVQIPPYAENQIDTPPLSVAKDTEEQCQSNIGKLLKENSIHFPTASSRISPESFDLLNELVKITQECPETRIRIAGHTDNIGEDEKNSALSLDRAEAVKLFFQKAGIPAHRLRAVGYGASSPIDDNNTEEGRRRNRRIEIHLTTP